MTDRMLAGHLPLDALQDMHRHSGRFLALGIVLIVLGMIGVSAAELYTVVSVVLFGWLLVFAGASMATHAFWLPRWSGFFLQLFSGVLSLVVGWTIAVRPGIGAETLTLVLAISLVVQGILRIGTAIRAHVDGRGWLFLSGLVTLLLGLMIWNQWPLSGLWVIGLFIGIDMIVYGTWIVSLALAVRRLQPAVV